MNFDSLPVLAWGLPLLAAVLIYFQLYVPVANGNLNICVADPFIVIGASLFALSAPSNNEPWRLPYARTILAFCTLAIVAAFVHGWLAFGSNSWGTTKAFGWFVLVGYALAAALIVRVGGERGRHASREKGRGGVRRSEYSSARRGSVRAVSR